MPINSKNKGKRGELAWSRFCRGFGYDVRRTAQFCGNNEAGAADCVGIKGVHQEVKFVERLNIQDAMDQSIRDARLAQNGEIPIVAHKRSNCEWLVTMRACDFLKVYKEYESGLILDELNAEKRAKRRIFKAREVSMFENGNSGEGGDNDDDCDKEE